MKLTSTVTIRYVEIETDEEYLAWRAGLAVLLDVLERYHNQQAERARAGDEPAPNALEVTGTNGDVELDNHRIQQIAEPVCF